jgi:CxxC motif-containing protein (DUF1111 family)
MSLSVLGDGFVEAIDSNTLAGIANNQRVQTGGRIAGQFIQVPVLEAPGNNRGGRFGWKNQQASLLSFAAGAYLNEQGITSRLQPTDTTTVCKTTTDPEDQIGTDGKSDTDHLLNSCGQRRCRRWIRWWPTADAQAGSRLFAETGCALCHLTSFHGAGCFGQQGYPSLQRLPAARRRHGRWNCAERSAGYGEQIPDGAAVGTTYSRSPDARRNITHA